MGSHTAEPWAARESRSAEDAARLHVAACYRLLAHYGLSDLSDGFVSARIGADSADFVIGGYGLFPELARASQLHRRSLGQVPQLEKLQGVDLDAQLFTRAILRARDGINACIHAHARHIIALSSLECDLLPLSQWGVMYQGLIGFLPFVTAGASSAQYYEQISDFLRSGKQAIFLRNHGVLVQGRTVAEAFFALHRLEQACMLQLMAMQTSVPLVMPTPAEVTRLQRSYWTMTHADTDGSREWPGLLKKLDLLDPSYRE
jgi:ribulose-5-phosphate 4-epimerase/fuculose-1-phosphate aldolase